MKDSQLFNEEILKRFKILNARGRLAHSYIFIGPGSIGKSETALAVAKLLNCEKQMAGSEYFFCDECPSCRKINSGNHPDIHIFAGTIEEGIKIEQVRELLSQIRLRPFEAAVKIFIIKNAEYLTIEAANCLLKTLEEPPANSLLFLTTAAADNILETIRSRCQAVYFYPLSSLALKERLREHYGIEKIEAQFLAYFSQGSLRKALELKETKIFLKKNNVLDQFVFSGQGDNLIQKISSEKEHTKEFLNILFTWIRDASLLKSGVPPEQMVHLDRLGELQQFVKKFPLPQLMDLEEDIVKAYQLLTDNLNIKLPLLMIKEKLSYG